MMYDHLSVCLFNPPRRARLGLACGVLLLSLILVNASLWAHPTQVPTNDDPRELTIYHTSDMHGYILPHRARWYTANPTRKIGGFVALAAAIERDQAAEPSPYLLLDSGDFFQGAPEGTLSKGRSVVKLMNALGYHASAIGNHEYDFGEANLIELAKLAEFPLLASNIQLRESGAPVDYAQPWALFERGGVRVGVVGLATRETSTATLPTHVSHLRFVHEVEAARPHVQALRAAGADIVIALTHCGIGPSVSRRRVRSADYVPPPEDAVYPGDILIAREAGVDLVLGGHAHAAFDELWTPKGGAPIAQSGEHLEHVTRITVKIDAEGEVSIEGKLIQLWADQVRSRPKISDLVEEVTAEVQQKMGEVIARAADPLPRSVEAPTGQKSRDLDGPLPNLFCDEMRRVAQSDFALHNTFGFRNDIGAGAITVGHLYQVMPFENTLAVMQLSGAQIRQLIVSNLKGNVSRLQVSSELTVNVTEDAVGSAIPESVKVMFKGAPIDLKKTYRVAMNSYMSSGGSCCRALGKLQHHDTAISLRVLFMDTVKRLSPVHAPKTGRIQARRHVSPTKPSAKMSSTETSTSPTP